MQRVTRLLQPIADRYLHGQCLCHRGLSSVGQVRNQLKHLDGGSVDLMKDETNGIATILINNPSKKNAMSGKMMVDFGDCVKELEIWNAGKCVILAGADGTFCSGGYLKTVNDWDGISKVMYDVTSRLFNLPMISVAAVDGYALGGGAELLTACDFRIAKPTAKIGFVQVKMNVAPGWGGCTRLVNLLGRTKALEMLTSGIILDADAAYRLGFVNEVLEENGDIIELGKKWLNKKCIGNTASTRVIKQMVLAGVQFDEVESLKQERQLFSQVWGKEAHFEALGMNRKHK